MPPLAPVAGAGVLPERVDVVVIGGGIIGAVTALCLAEAGQSVALCEKGAIGAEQSSRNWGWCRTMGRDPAEIPLSAASLALWREMHQRIGAETGFRAAGILFALKDARAMAAEERWLAIAQAAGLRAQMLDRPALSARLPGLSGRFAGGMLTEDDGRAEPALACPAIARAAGARGAHLLTGCAVRALIRTGGRVTGVVTERGPIRADAVVLAGGAWSRLFCGNAGVALPVLKILGSVLRTAPLAGAPEISVGGPDFAFRKRLDGGYTIARRNASTAEIVPDSFRLMRPFLPALAGAARELRLRVGAQFITEWRMKRRWAADEASPFEATRILDPAPQQHLLSQALARVSAAFPVFRAAQVTESWAGWMDVTPDALPVIGAVPAIPGFYMASGFSGHGFGIAPAAGRLMADMVLGRTPIVDPTPFRLARFGGVK